MGRRFSHQAVDVDAPPVEKSSLKLQDRSPGTPMKTCQDSIDEDGNLLFISTPPLPRLQPVGDQKLRPTSPKAKNVENKTAAERAWTRNYLGNFHNVHIVWLYVFFIIFTKKREYIYITYMVIFNNCPVYSLVSVFIKNFNVSLHHTSCSLAEKKPIKI